MSEPPPPPARRRILRNLLLLFFAFTLLSFALLGWWVTTDAFQQRVRHRVIAKLERATGGRVELGELHTIPFRLRIDARNLTIHGNEPADQAPFIQVERLQAELKIIALFETSIGLHSLTLEHPAVHIVNYPDGTTNVPAPMRQYSSDRGPIENLISLSVAHIEAHDGSLLWDDRKVPFDFDARDLSLLLNYSLLHQRYETRATAGSVSTKWQQYPEFTWSADASLLLGRSHADIKSLTLKSGQSEFHFAGALQDFHDPHLTGDYRGVADLGELARIALQPQLRQGTVEFSGKGSWSLSDFSAQGKLDAKGVDWANGKHFALRNAHLQADFTVDPARFFVSSLKANLLGGSVAGDVNVINWQNSLPTWSEFNSNSNINSKRASKSSAARRSPARATAGSMQRGAAHLQLSRFPLTPILDAISSSRFPLDRLDFAAGATGSVELLWIGSIYDAESRWKLDLSPDSSSPNLTSVSGHVDGAFRASRDELELSALHLKTASSEIEAAGTIAPGSALHASINTHNIREWMPLLQAIYGSSQLPFVLRGWANLTGDTSGSLSALSFAGNLEAYDFETGIPATARTSAEVVHWDVLSTAFQYSSNNFSARNGALVHGHTVTHFDLTAALADGSLLANGPFTAHLDILNGDLAELARFVNLKAPVSGRLGLTLNLSGVTGSPRGDGHFEIRDATLSGVPVPSASGTLKLVPGELSFTNLQARILDASLSGSGSLSTTADDFLLNLTGRNLNLAHVPQLHSSRFRMDGSASFTARIAGTPQQPSLDAHVQLKDLALDNRRSGDFYIDATTLNRQLNVHAHSAFEKSALTIDGSVALDRDFPADLKLDFHDLDLVSLLNIYLPGKLPGRAPAGGIMQLRGPLRRPRELKAQADIAAFSAEVERIQIQNTEPIRLEIADESLRIESLHLAGSGTDFTAHGRIHLSSAQEMDLGLDGSVNMTLLQLLNPKILARGNLGVNLTATGNLHQPILQGRLDVQNTFVSHSDFPSGLSNLNGILSFDRNHIQIQNLSGTTGGGVITLTGSADYENANLRLDLGASARDVRLRYPPGVSSTADADLRLTGSTAFAVLSGDIVVTKLAVTPGFDFGAYIEQSSHTVVFTQADSLASRLRLDVHVSTTPELQMQTAIARLSGDADLRLRGTADRPVILGRAEVLEGEISFNGNKYSLERGDVTFANPAKTQPIVDLQATTRVRDYDITVRFRGDASVPNGLKISWQSEPQLPEADVIALLALGRTQEESNYAQSAGSLGFGGDASNLLINQALNSSVSSRVQRLFGVSRIKIDPQGLASQTSVIHGTQGPQVTVEQQVVHNLTVTYSTNVSVSNQQIIQAEYNLTRNISIIALRDQNGVVSFDLKIRRRKK